MPRRNLILTGSYELFKDDTDKYKFNLVLNYDYIPGWYAYQVMQPKFKYWLIFLDNKEYNYRFKQFRHAYWKITELHTLYVNFNK